MKQGSPNWNRFMALWEAKEYEQAIQLQLYEQERTSTSVINKLFRNQDIESAAISGIAFLDILYD